MDDLIGYERYIDSAMRTVVRNVLQRAVDEGLPGQHHFYISFDTRHPDVEIGDTLHAKHPEEMTIVLQHQFWDLNVARDSFTVALSFGGARYTLVIPFTAIRAFSDPSVNFTLQFGHQSGDRASLIDPLGEISEEEIEELLQEEFDASQGTFRRKDGEHSADVISIDTFRKK